MPKINQPPTFGPKINTSPQEALRKELRPPLSLGSGVKLTSGLEKQTAVPTGLRTTQDRVARLSNSASSTASKEGLQSLIRRRKP